MRSLPLKRNTGVRSLTAGAGTAIERNPSWIETLELGMEIAMSLFSKNRAIESRLTELTQSFPMRCVPLAFVGILLVVARHGVWQGV